MLKYRYFCSLLKEKLQIEGENLKIKYLIINMFRLFHLFHFSVEQNKLHNLY
jgi:hypothetical protein